MEYHVKQYNTTGEYGKFENTDFPQISEDETTVFSC